MGSIVICAFRPKPGQEAELLEVVKTHMPTLKGQDYITDRPATVMRSTDGTILEVFEWKSEEHTRQAHEDPVVLAMWKRFGACCDYVTLRDLAETESPFPNFKPIDLT